MQLTRLRRWIKGRPLLARQLDEPARALNQGRGVPPPRQVSARALLHLTRFRVVSMEGDYLVCLPLNVGAVENVKVAKPWDLRRTPFDGLTVNGISYTYSSEGARTATAGESEDQVVIPAYFAGAEIYAVDDPIGGTGVTDENAAEVTYQDVNLAGRAWAVASEE